MGKRFGGRLAAVVGVVSGLLGSLVGGEPTAQAAVDEAVCKGIVEQAKTKPRKRALDCKPEQIKNELKMVTLAPNGSKWAQEFTAWADDAATVTDCALSLKWYFNGGGGGEERMFDDLSQGQKHGAAMTAVGLSKIYMDVLLFQLPGAFNTWAELDAARNKEKTFFEQEFEKRGYIIAGWGDTGAGKILSVGAPINLPTDLKGKGAFHLPGDSVGPALINQVKDVIARPMPLTELATHLGKDVQVITTSPYAAEQLQLASKITHITKLTTGFGIGGLVFKKQKIDTLSDTEKAVLLCTGKAHGDSLTNTIRNEDAAAFKRLYESKLAHDPTEAERKAWADVFAATRKSLRGAPFTPAVYDRVIKN